MADQTRFSRQLALLIGVAMLLALAAVAYFVVVESPREAPQIQGNYIASPTRLPDFTLTDHRGEMFTREDLLGRWHFVSYGYTYCPDICPITLSALAQVVDRLEREQEHTDLGVIFYTVDHARDTRERLAEYMPYFNEDFIGLTVTGAAHENHHPFEHGLGIVYEIETLDDRGGGDAYNYLVNHGILLYLINPRGNLQAIFEPEKSRHGIYHFSVEQLYRDYLEIVN